MKRIIFKNLDGSVGVVIPSLKSGLTVEETAIKDVPNGLSYRIADIADVPSDRHFRKAWADTSELSTIDIDIVKAREVQKDHIRSARAPLLDDLDVRQLRGEDVEAEKQSLRDMPSQCENVTDLEELKLIIPTGE